MQSTDTSGFPYFEEDNFLGWLVSMKAHLRKQKRAHICLEQPPPKPPVDDAGNPVPLTQAQHLQLKK